ncbi:hypothetical protein BA022_04625 [Diaphorobacter nitroreducens]|nr:hypothetical protein BA022_04625 [Diaphorobacter nitroreducens]
MRTTTGEVAAQCAAQSHHELGLLKLRRLPFLEMATEIRGIAPGLDDDLVNGPGKEFRMAAHQVAQRVLAATLVTGHAFERGQRMLDRACNLWLRPPRQIPQRLAQFAGCCALALLLQLLYALPDSDFESLGPANLQPTINQLPADTHAPKAAIHLVFKGHLRPVTGRRKRLHEIIDLEPFQILDKFTHLAVNVGKLGPVVSVRGAVEDGAQNVPQVARFELAPIGDRDDGITKFRWCLMTNRDFRIWAFVTMA